MSFNPVPGRAYFAAAKIGLFTHYTYGTVKDPAKNKLFATLRSPEDLTNPADCEEVAAAFDAEAFADAAADMEAQYVVFTLCHSGFNLLFPSQTMLRTGMTHKCSKTDVIAPLLDALNRRSIPLCLYIPPNDDHDIPDDDLRAMGWYQSDDAREAFINELIAEIGERYGGRIAGFWFDQCGPRPSTVAAVRAVNPDTVVWINEGRTANDVRHPLSDFKVSEYFGQVGADTDSLASHGSQVNLVFGGCWMALGGTATMTPEAMYRYTVRCAATTGSYNCGVNWAGGPYVDQRWENGCRELMHGFGELVRAHRGGLISTVPGVSYPTVRRGAVLTENDWGVSTEMVGGGEVYLHILNYPADAVLNLPAPADGRVFTEALKANGVPVGIDSLPDGGYRVYLPRPDPVDTVITLRS